MSCVGAVCCVTVLLCVLTGGNARSAHAQSHKPDTKVSQQNSNGGGGTYYIYEYHVHSGGDVTEHLLEKERWLELARGLHADLPTEWFRRLDMLTALLHWPEVPSAAPPGERCACNGKVMSETLAALQRRVWCLEQDTPDVELCPNITASPTPAPPIPITQPTRGATSSAEDDAVSVTDGIQSQRPQALPVNLLSLPGVNCTASSVGNNYVCENAYDGVTDGGHGNEWVSDTEGDGAWLEVTFPSTVQVQAIELWQRCSVKDQFSRCVLTFSDGSQQEITMPCNGSSHYLECAGVPPEYRQLTMVPTSSVRLTLYGDCRAGWNNGIREMKIYGLI